MRTTLSLFLALVFALPVTVQANFRTIEPEKRSPIIHNSRLRDVDTWGYQAQNITVAEIAAAPHEMLVIDYSRDGTEKGEWTPEEVAEMKAGGKLLLASLSIGEAEDYRFYWQRDWHEDFSNSCFETYYDEYQRRWDYKNNCTGSTKDLIGPQNPSEYGKYAVQYWKNDWWTIALQPYLRKIIDQGFDGVYLEGIDMYDFWDNPKEMNALILKVSEVAKQRAGDDFLVVPENGMRLLQWVSARSRESYLTAIDGIALTSLFFDTSPEDRALGITLLKYYKQKSLPIFDREFTSKKNEGILQSALEWVKEKKNIDIILYRANNDDNASGTLNPPFIPQKY